MDVSEITEVGCRQNRCQTTWIPEMSGVVEILALMGFSSVANYDWADVG